MLDLVRILVRWRRPLLGASLAAALAAGIYAFSVAPRYAAQASILPPSEEPGFGGISQLLQQYQIPVPGGTTTPFLPTLYASIVSSRKMSKLILDEFHLREQFKTTTEEDAYAALRNRTSLTYTDDGLFLVGYQDEDPQRAADVVNAFVRHLDEIILQVNSGRAGQTRAFVETQLTRCSADLNKAEEAMRDFQRQHRAIQIDAQTEGALGLAAELQGRILAAEVELDLLRQRTLPAAPELQQKTRELAALRSQYQGLSGKSGGDDTMFPKFDSVPDLALQYLRLMRDLKVQETLYTLLMQQLEQARIEERKNTPVLSVLDSAEPTSRPVYPRKMLLVLVGAVAAAVWVGIIAVLVEKMRARRPGPEEAERLMALRDEWERMPPWVRRIERLVGR
jgi:uncharacterized protein involved in exopolysaccharide biosynthesis